jgi:hypothetical protein
MLMDDSLLVYLVSLAFHMFEPFLLLKGVMYTMNKALSSWHSIPESSRVVLQRPAHLL